MFRPISPPWVKWSVSHLELPRKTHTQCVCVSACISQLHELVMRCDAVGTECYTLVTREFGQLFRADRTVRFHILSSIPKLRSDRLRTCSTCICDDESTKKLPMKLSGLHFMGQNKSQSHVILFWNLKTLLASRRVWTQNFWTIRQLNY